MSTSWCDGYAQCPYYIRDDRKRRIDCNGVADGIELSWIFKNKQDFKIQLNAFCCGKYRNCEVYRMLEEVYGED